MLEIEERIELQLGAKNKNFIVDLFNKVDTCVLKGNAEKTINALQTFKETEADERIKLFVDFLIELVNDGNDKIKLSAQDEAIATSNNWTRLRRLVAQRGLSINSLSKITGIAHETLSKHLIDESWKLKHFRKLIEALNIPNNRVEYYFFPEYAKEKARQKLNRPPLEDAM